MKRVPIYFDASIDLVSIMRLLAGAGYTLRGNGFFELIVVKDDDQNDPPVSNVIPFRRPPCER